jgi:hypothetical protein
MSPVWLIEGGASEAEAGIPGEDESAQPSRFPSSPDQRLSALAAAIREHESRNRHTAMPARPQDMVLYRRLRQICGEREVARAGR